MKTIFTLLVSILFVYNLNAQPGTLDYSFGDSGKVSSQYFGNCYSMLVQADDKIVCAGINYYKLQAVRYLPDGAIDSSFGNNGVVYPNITETNPQITSMVLQPDQKILLSADCYKNGVPTIVLIRLLPDGSFDESFGRNGIMDSVFGSGESIPHIALQPDGKIVLAGWYYSGFIIIRFNDNGKIDEGFGDKGKIITDFGSSTVPTDIKIDASGRIIVSGDKGGTSYSKFLLARYTSQGILDRSFGNNGVITTDFGKYGDYLESISIQSDGKIVGAGVTGTDFRYENENIAIIRYEPNGNLDSSFGQNGKATIIFDGLNSQANSLLVTDDNKILLGGGIGGAAEGNSADFVLIRLLSNGALDSSFGINGETVTDFGLYETRAHISFQNNKIILAGTSYTSEPQNQINYALVRYNNDESHNQILITKIRRWLQHHNGIVWDNMPGVKSYAVQRSSDGVKWTTVHSQQATVNTQSSIINSPLSTVNYYNDASPLPATNYYRLQATSVDGAVAYSNVIAISSEVPTVSLSPNPAKNVLRIEGLSSSNKTKITVVDLSGNVAISQQLSTNSPSYNLNIATLKPGNYLLKIEESGEVIVKKFVKL